MCYKHENNTPVPSITPFSVSDLGGDILMVSDVKNSTNPKNVNYLLKTSYVACNVFAALSKNTQFLASR